jgi:hypothetical protein
MMPELAKVVPLYCPLAGVVGWAATGLIITGEGRPEGAAIMKSGIGVPARKDTV